MTTALAERVRDYLREHPGAHAHDIANALDELRTHGVMAELHSLKRDGLVTQDDEGGWVPIDPPGKLRGERATVRSSMDKMERVRRVLIENPAGITSEELARKVSTRAWQPPSKSLHSILKRLGCVWYRRGPSDKSMWRLPVPSDGDIKVRYVTALPGLDNGLLSAEEVDELTEFFMDKNIPYDNKQKLVEQINGLFALAVLDQEVPPEEEEPAEPEYEDPPFCLTTWIPHFVSERVNMLEVGDKVNSVELVDELLRTIPPGHKKIDVRTLVWAELRDYRNNKRFLKVQSRGRLGTDVTRTKKGLIQ